jgi:hypothetical protein
VTDVRGRLLVAALALLLTGCSVSPGLIGPLPTISDKDNAAEIIVIRESHFAGSLATLPVTLDGALTGEKALRCELGKERE